jgi:hypothetical protein
MNGDVRGGSAVVDVEIELAMDVAWERTFGEIGLGSSDDDEEIGGSTVLCVLPRGPALRPTHASIDDALRDEGLHQEVACREKGADRRCLPPYAAAPIVPLRFVCLVEHVEAGDACFVAAPTISEFRRVVMERRLSRRITEQAKLTWLPMRIEEGVGR